MSTNNPALTLDQEINPWEAQSARFEFAARKLNLDEGLWKLLRTPAREIIVHFPVAMDDGRIEMFTGFQQYVTERSAAAYADKPRRGVGLMELALRAGAIASSSGNAKVAPMPRRNVRRGRATPVTNRLRNIVYNLLLILASGRRNGGRFRRLFLRLPHLEWRALHYA